MEDKKKKPETPRRCIRNYCLYQCSRGKEKQYSKREVAECVYRKCPLHPYRTGIWRNDMKPLSNFKKERRITKLRTARRKVDRLEKNMELVDSQLTRLAEKTAARRKEKQEMQAELDEAKAYVELVEKQIDEEMEAGLWEP